GPVAFRREVRPLLEEEAGGMARRQIVALRQHRGLDAEKAREQGPCQTLSLFGSRQRFEQTAQMPRFLRLPQAVLLVKGIRDLRAAQLLDQRVGLGAAVNEHADIVRPQSASLALGTDARGSAQQPGE